MRATWYTEDFAELSTAHATLAIGSTRTVPLFAPGAARPADNRTVIIEFLVDDVDGVHQNLAGFVEDFVQEPTTMPWGNRSLLFRDPGFRDLFDTNVLGYFLVARAVVPHMLQAGRGKIVNISVNEATMRRRGFTPYGPSRAATDALSHIMAADLAGTGIDVNLLLPGGATRTGMTPDSAPEDLRASWLDPAIMGPPVCWLASRASDGITDQRIVATEFDVIDPRQHG